MPGQTTPVLGLTMRSHARLNVLLAFGTMRLGECDCLTEIALSRVYVTYHTMFADEVRWMPLIGLQELSQIRIDNSSHYFAVMSSRVQ